MSQDLTTETYIENQIAQFNVTDHGIAELNKKYGDLTIKDFSDLEGYEIIKTARRHVKEIRVNLEHKRKELVENPMRIKQQIDAEAKRRKEQLETLETKLESQEKAFDAEKERVKKEKLIEEEKKYQSRIQQLIDLEFSFNGSLWQASYGFANCSLLIKSETIRSLSDDDFNKEIEKFKIDYTKDIEERIKEAEVANLQAIQKENEEAKIKEANKAAADESMRLQREELDRKQMAIDVEKSRLKKEREEKEEEYKKLREEQEELRLQKISLRINKLDSLGITFSARDNSYCADFFEGQLYHKHTLDNLPDQEFNQVFNNFMQTKEAYINKQKAREEAEDRHIMDATAEQPKIVDATHIDFTGVLEIERDPREEDLLRCQRIIKEQCVEILNAYKIHPADVILNTTNSRWNVEHRGYRLFSCNIGEYIESMKDKS